MKIKKGQLVELSISETAFGGKGLARINGMAVFVDNAVPFDTVIARIVKKKKQYAEARVETLVNPSPFRVNPPCVYSNLCGGCKWQFLKYDKQLVYKRQHVIDSIEHIALLQGVTVNPGISSPLIFGYRNKMEFSCSDRRWLMPEEMGQDDVDNTFALGLHVPGTFYKVLDIEKCPLQPEQGNHILNDVKSYIKNSDQPVYGLHSHVGFWRFLMLRHSVAYDKWMVNIITSKEDRKTVQPLADYLISKYDKIESVVNNITAKKASIAVGEYEIVLAGASSIRDKIGPYDFNISANSFFQTNTRGAEQLYKIVLEYSQLSGKETVLDLYCGTGTISIALSGYAKKVFGMEIVESAIADAEYNCKLNRISNCRFITGDIRKTLTDIDIIPDVMIIDPPRTGMHKDIANMVLEMAPERIVYVSCNPATMARDLLILKEKYEVPVVQPVDMFPHTFHIESVAKLEKKY